MKTITIIMTMSICISKVLLKSLALQTSLVVIKDVRLGRPALYIVYKKKVKVNPKSHQCNVHCPENASFSEPDQDLYRILINFGI